MTAAHSDDQVTEGITSLEVRWIFPGQAGTAVAGWFGRFPAEVEAREDAYLLDPQLRGLAVKVRGGKALEVKVYRGSAGILQLAGRARGRVESWQKWSFPCGAPGQGGAVPAGWVPVHKRISRFSVADGQIGTQMTGPTAEPGCMAELTEIHTHGQVWWTLGFEATGPTSLLGRELETAVVLVLDQDPPEDIKLDAGHSQSYAEWLGSRRSFRLG